MGHLINPCSFRLGWAVDWRIGDIYDYPFENLHYFNLIFLIDGYLKKVINDVNNFEMLDRSTYAYFSRFPKFVNLMALFMRIRRRKQKVRRPKFLNKNDFLKFQKETIQYNKFQMLDYRWIYSDLRLYWRTNILHVVLEMQSAHITYILRIGYIFFFLFWKIKRFGFSKYYRNFYMLKFFYAMKDFKSFTHNLFYYDFFFLRIFTTWWARRLSIQLNHILKTFLQKIGFINSKFFSAKFFLSIVPFYEMSARPITTYFSRLLSMNLKFRKVVLPVFLGLKRYRWHGIFGVCVKVVGRLGKYPTRVILGRRVLCWGHVNYSDILADVDYSYTRVLGRYGAYSVKLWIFRKKALIASFLGREANRFFVFQFVYEKMRQNIRRLRFYVNGIYYIFLVYYRFYLNNKYRIKFYKNLFRRKFCARNEGPFFSGILTGFRWLKYLRLGKVYYFRILLILLSRFFYRFILKMRLLSRLIKYV